MESPPIDLHPVLTFRHARNDPQVFKSTHRYPHPALEFAVLWNKKRNNSCGSFVNSWIRYALESTAHSLTLTHTKEDLVHAYQRSHIRQFSDDSQFLMDFSFFSPEYIGKGSSPNREASCVHSSITRNPACLRGISVLILRSGIEIPNVWFRSDRFAAIPASPKQGEYCMDLLMGLEWAKVWVLNFVSVCTGGWVGGWVQWVRGVWVKHLCENKNTHTKTY